MFKYRRVDKQRMDGSSSTATPPVNTLYMDPHHVYILQETL
jgi:hypothetical protein